MLKICFLLFIRVIFELFIGKSLISFFVNDLGFKVRVKFL